LIRRNPCRIKGAGDELPEERLTLTIGQVYQLADLMPARLRLLILVATFAGLRYGEVTALQRTDIDLRRGSVRIRQAFSEVTGQGWVPARRSLGLASGSSRCRRASRPSCVRTSRSTSA
jgi:integrase